MDLVLARKRLGLTQKQIAEKLCIDQGTVAHWEKGDWLPNVTRLPIVAETYGITVDEILASRKKGSDVK